MSWDDRLTKACGHFTVILLGLIILLSGADLGTAIWEAILIVLLVTIHGHSFIGDVEILINTKE